MDISNKYRSTHYIISRKQIKLNKRVVQKQIYKGKHQKYGEQQQIHQQEQQHNFRWLPLEEGFVKCNVDTALFGDQTCFGIGLCIRNSRDHFLKALTRRFECSSSFRSRGIGLERGYFMA